ncbi:MAG TPA: type I methionyl aminopeptidase [Bacteroidia bacterium]|nr:type I methionyl aminopeptidase [Bacteroidia bacterium]
MNNYRSEEEIELIRQSSLLVGKTLAAVAALLKPGVTTAAIDSVADKFIRDGGGIPAFKNYNGFPASVCVSVNSQVVHGIPGSYELKDGDVVSVDCGVLMNSFYGDSAYTFIIGEADEKVKNLLRVTKECLYKGIEHAVAGKRVGDISNAVQFHAESHGYSVVRELVGHGVGRKLHEKPEVPNYGNPGSGKQLQQGMTIAIEPMINMGKRNVIQERDGWTVRTSDGMPSAHFEHTVAVRKEKAEILSTFEFIEEALNKNKAITI